MKGKLQEKKLLYKVLAKKDPEAFGSLYDLYVEPIYRFVLYKVRSKEEAEDLVSDIFLKCWNYLISDKDSKVSNFRALIYKVARNTIIDAYRKKARSQEYPIEFAFELADAASEKLESKVDAKLILDQLSRLKHEYQEVIFLRFVEELSIKEIADALQKSQASVRVTLHRATKKFSDIISEPK